MNQVATTEQPEKTFNPDEDYYVLLGVSRDCNFAGIKKAYKKLANGYHPDKDGGNSEWFHLITEAFNVLSDPKSRENYDEHGRFTSDEYQDARNYIMSVVEQVVNQTEDLDHIDMVQTLKQTTAQNIQNANIELKKQERIKVKFEKNEKRTKDKTILEVFKKHKGVAIKAIENLGKNLRTFEIATIMLKDYEYNFDVRQEATINRGSTGLYTGITFR